MLDFLVITLVVLLITQWIRSKPFFWKDAGIPYSVPWPVLGNTASLAVSPIYRVMSDFYDRREGESGVYGFHFFGQPALVATDAATVKVFATKYSDHFMSHGFHTEQTYDPMGKGLFFAEGEQWKETKTKITPYFTPSRIKGMLPMIRPTAEMFQTYVSLQAEKGAVEFHSASIKYSVDIIMSTIFGLKPDSFDNPDSFFYLLQKEMISFFFGLKIALGILSPTLYKLFGFTVMARQTLQSMKRFINDVLDQRLGGGGTRPDFVQGMIELMQKEEASDKHGTRYYSDGTQVPKFDRFDVIGQCMMMYTAGTETTSNTLAFLFYELALHQDIQDRTRQEILALIEAKGEELDYDDFHQLNYTHMVIRETLRKHPSIPAMGRQCTKEFMFRGAKMPVGSMVMFSVFSLHHDPRYFPDPEAFNPERFRDMSGIVPGSYLPFGMGSRTCIGMKFAETEIALALCKILPKHRLVPCSRTEIPVQYSPYPSLSPKNGIYLVTVAV